MRRTLPAVFGLALLAALPAQAQEGATFAPMIGASLTEKFWVEPEEDAGRPGAIMLFLSEGTMMQTSCWEGYRLSDWQMTSDESLSWREDTVTIEADIVELDEAELVLALHLVDGETLERRFTAAPIPYVCPDMPR